MNIGSFVKVKAVGAGVVTRAWQLPSGEKQVEFRQLLDAKDTASLPTTLKAAQNELLLSPELQERSLSDVEHLLDVKYTNKPCNDGLFCRRTIGEC